MMWLFALYGQNRNLSRFEGEYEEFFLNCSAPEEIRNEICNWVRLQRAFRLSLLVIISVKSQTVLERFALQDLWYLTTMNFPNMYLLELDQPSIDECRQNVHA